MQAQEVLGGWLTEFGNQTGVGFQLDAQGVCSFEFEGTKIVIEAAPVGETVYLRSPLADMRDGDSEALYRALLELNFLCLETEGSTLALDAEENWVNLCYTYSIVGADQKGFAEVFMSFMQLAHKWEVRLQELMREVVDREQGAAGLVVEEDEHPAAALQPNMMA